MLNIHFPNGNGNEGGIFWTGTFSELRLVTILIVKVENMENSVISSVPKDSHHIPQRGFVKKVGGGGGEIWGFWGDWWGNPPSPKKQKTQVRNILSRERSHIPPTGKRTIIFKSTFSEGICFFFPGRVIFNYFFFVNLIWVKYDSKFTQESL